MSPTFYLALTVLIVCFGVWAAIEAKKVGG